MENFHSKGTKEGGRVSKDLPAQKCFSFCIILDILYYMKFWEQKFSKINHWFLDF